MMKAIGAVLILLGFIGLVMGGFSYNKTETVAQIGDLKMKATEKKQIPVPPLVSGMAILVGAAIVFAGSRKPTS
jgi:hypothetical protein